MLKMNAKNINTLGFQRRNEIYHHHSIFQNTFYLHSYDIKTAYFALPYCSIVNLNGVVLQCIPLARAEIVVVLLLILKSANSEW